MAIGDLPPPSLSRDKLGDQLLRARGGGTPTGTEMPGGNIAIIITSYFLLRRGWHHNEKLARCKC